MKLKAGRNLRLVAALVPFIALGGCSTISSVYDSFFGSSSTAAKPAALVDFKPSADVRLLWQANVASAGDYVYSPAITRSNVYVTGRDGQISSLERESGRGAWRVDAGSRVSSGVGAENNIVVVGTSKGEVLAFDGNGRSLWKSQLSSEILSPAQIAEDIVVVRTGDNKIYGLNVADGKRKWVYEQRATPALTLRNYAGVVISRGALFAGLPGGKLVAMDLATGNVGWESTVASPRGVTELDRVADITSEPILDESQVCAVAYQGRLACFDLVRGTQLWARDVSSHWGLAMDKRYVYVTDEKGAVMAYDKASGNNIWKQDKLLARRVSGPQLAGKYLAVADYQGYVHVLNRDDGSFVGRVATDGSPVMVQPQALGENLLVQTRNGGVFAITAR